MGTDISFDRRIVSSDLRIQLEPQNLKITFKNAADIMHCPCAVLEHTKKVVHW